MQDVPRLFTNDVGSIYQYEDGTGGWRWGLIVLRQHLYLRESTTQGKAVQTPPNWISYAALD
jgi:hypothetical protein